MRTFPPLFLLVCLGVSLVAATSLHASEALTAPPGGHSVTVQQPHVTAELIAETAPAGKPFDVALHLHMDADWHTYWINPGDAGLATAIAWKLPPGWSVGPIQWPTPEQHAMGPLTTYGYGGDVYLLTTITPPAKIAAPAEARVPLQADATWLVCQEECIPGQANLSVQMKPEQPPAQDDAFFQAARTRLPVPNTRWDVRGNYQAVGTGQALVVNFKEKGAPAPLGNLYFFPEQSNVLSVKQTGGVESDKNGSFDLVLPLQQNGEKPAQVSGVLVSGQPLIGQAKAISIQPFSTHDASVSVPSASTSPSAASTASPAPSGAATARAAGAKSAASAVPFLPGILVFAFLGGLILNLMPCVLPVLSLKVFSLIRHAGENAGGAWKQGLAFTAGVVISFWILAGLLIALEAAGSHLGWGFQMQSPGFVLALILLFFLLGLNLFGVFEVGASLVGIDAKATSHLGGLASSFANGALAVLAATPCTAPFMGSAVGFAAEQPAAISLLVFTFLALGMAAPYLALTAFPGALRLVPKPGAWMEELKQFMGFLLMGTVIFLVYVFGALVGTGDMPLLLGVLLLAALAAWIFGRGCTPVHATVTRILSALAAGLFLGAAVVEGAHLTCDIPTPASSMQDGWQPYSPGAVQHALKAGHPAFVDFTAAWCLSCKVNEQVALDVASTKKLFAQKHVALFRGDWTHSDPQITKTLREFNRDGVPLYLLYSPQNPSTPQVLPEVLTPGIVRDALQKVP